MNRYALLTSVVTLTMLSLACSIGSVVQQAAPLATQAAQSVETSAPKVVQSTPSAPTQSAATGGPSAQGVAVDKNIIFNGDAEAGPGAPDDSKVVPAPGWTATGKFTVVQYGASGGFQDQKAAGPKDRGKNYFVGGPDNEQSSAQQSIDVSSMATLIDAQQLTYKFEGWLGGFGGQNDNATVTAEFFDGSGKSLKKTAIGPVKAADRKGEDGSVLRSTAGAVPKGTRKITIVMTFVRTDGSYNDGSVDNLSLVLTKAAPG